jgi:thiamine biosynthesis protein ThiS
MQVTVNGEARTVDDGLTVAGLVAELDLAPERVAVEVNAQLVRRAEHAERALQNGDQVEIVTLVGGG